MSFLRSKQKLSKNNRSFEKNTKISLNENDHSQKKRSFAKNDHSRKRTIIRKKTIIRPKKSIIRKKTIIREKNDHSILKKTNDHFFGPTIE